MKAIVIDLPEDKKPIEVEDESIEVEMKDVMISEKLIPGPKGENGKDGETPSEEQLIALIEPRIPKPKDGKTPTKTEIKQIIKEVLPEDKLIEKIVKKVPRGKDGEQGKDGKSIRFADLTPYEKQILSGPPGSAGQGVPRGGTVNQKLIKSSSRDFHTEWADDAGGGGTWGSIIGTLADQTDLQAALDGKEPAKGADDNYVTDAEKVVIGNTSGTNTGDQNLSGYQITSEKGNANGYAELDSGGKVPSAQLPAYVDDVLEYANFAALPGTGTTGIIYITLDDNKTYRWSGSVYVEISASLALGETSSTAYRGDRGKTAYDHSQITTGNPHNVLATQISDFDTEVANNADVAANTAKQTNATHSGDIVGATSTTAQPAIITGKPSATVASDDLVLIADVNDSNNLKQVTAQSIADLAGGLSDGDKGDITVSSSGTVWTIDNDAVTYAKMQNVAADNVLLGNNSGAGGVVDELTASEVRTIINVEDGADVTDATNVGAAGAFMKSVDDTDDITVGTTNKFATAAEKTKLGNITVTQAVDLDQMETDIAALANGMVYKGNWDASAGTFPGAGAAQAGWLYTVSVGGTVDSVVFNVGDRLIATVDNASATTFASNWSMLDATDAVTSVFGRVGNVVATNGDYTATQITNTPAGNIASTTVQAALNELDTEKVQANGAITGATKTKVTYDSKGLVTAGADATTADIADSSNKRYITDAQQTILGNTSGTNSGNETTTTEGALILGATAKTTPVDTDYIGLMDSAASNILKKLSWLNIKATLKTYFDTLYQAAGSYLTSGGALGTPSSGTLTNVTGLTEAGQTLADNTTNDVSTTKHGYAPKGDGSTSKFLNANGAYSTPAASTITSAVRAYLTTSAQTISTGYASRATVQFNAESFDVDGEFNTSTYTFTPAATGKYQINIHLGWNNWSSSDCELYLVIGGVESLVKTITYAGSGSWTMDYSDLLTLTATSSTVLVKVAQYTGGNRNINTGEYVTNFSIKRVS